MLLGSKEKSQLGWAIIGRHGLYTGWWRRRCDAMAAHASEARRIEEPEVSPFVHGRQLDEAQQIAWERCRARGDRLVRINIVWNNSRG